MLIGEQDDTLPNVDQSFGEAVEPQHSAAV
jgi:hypothetical protein